MGCKGPMGPGPSCPADPASAGLGRICPSLPNARCPSDGSSFPSVRYCARLPAQRSCRSHAGANRGSLDGPVPPGRGACRVDAALARQLGISTMALYTYFPTKAHLMHHIWADMLRLACAQGELAGAESPCDWSRLDACLQGFLLLDGPSRPSARDPGGLAGRDGWTGVSALVRGPARPAGSVAAPLVGTGWSGGGPAGCLPGPGAQPDPGHADVAPGASQRSRAAQQGLIECATQAALASLRHRLGCQAAIAG
jgi:AcrR family transcriptional regulator